MPIEKYVKPDDWYFDYATEILPTGSRVICDVGPNQATQKDFFKNSDEDYMLLLEEGVVKPLETRLEAEGWVLGGSLNKPKTKAQYIHISRTAEYESNGYTVKKLAGADAMVMAVKYNKVSLKDLPPLKAYPDMETQEGLFRSWKKERINLLLTCSPDYFENFCKATSLAKRLNLLKKEDRVSLFEAITRDVWPNQKPSRYSVGESLFAEDMAMEEPAPVPNMVEMQQQAAFMEANPPVLVQNQHTWS